MMRTLRYILACILTAASTLLPAQNGIEIKTPERIVRMLESMPISNIPHSGQFRCSELSSTLVFYTESDLGVTVQLGTRLFSDAVRKAYDPVIISFTERLWVELLLRKTTTSQASLLKEYGVRIVLNGYPLGSGSFKQLSQALDVINSLTSLSITTGGSEIDMFMRDQAGSTLHIYIPASRDLLYPYDKKEHEEFFISKLTANRAGYSQPAQIQTEGSVSTTPNGLTAIGGECYMIDSLRNDIFLDKNSKLVFSAQYPEESMRNALMCTAGKKDIQNITLDITPHTYNRDIKGFKISLDSFLGFIQRQGFRLYTGDAGRTDNKCQCILVMYHPVYNYLHMLSVSFTPDQIGSGKDVLIKADLSTFIPQHNIKNLFQEK